VSESQVDGSAQNELDSLKAAIAAFGASEDEAQAVEPQLRSRRRALAEKFLALDDGLSQARFAAHDGEYLRLIVHCGLRDLERDPEDEALARRTRAHLGTATPPAGALLAAMLLFQPYELPPPEDLGAVADWLRPDYTRFLLTTPRIFLGPGDADRYCDGVIAAVTAIHQYVFSHPELPSASQLLSILVTESSLLQIYFNERNLKDLYRRRAQLMESWALAQGARLAHTFPLRPQNAPQRRLRVGILCRHFGPQTETYFMLAHFERFPRERCTLFLYAMSDRANDLSQYARSIADATIDLPADNVVAAAERIRADDLDVLLIGSNITVAFDLLGVLASYRLARVQVISASSPTTSGLTAADWYLNAEENEAADAAEQYTEEVYRMPGMLTRYAYHLDKDPRTVTLDRGDLGIPKNAVVFFSASNFFKVIPELSATWARIMAQLPEARLLLMPFNTNWSHNYLSQPLTSRVLRQVEEAGGDPEKVHIMDALPTRADLHSVMALADIYLDSYPFAGACSLLDPLLVGLPVVARTGRNFRSGVGAGMLRGLGIGDMAAADEESYISRAVSLAKSADLRKREGARIEAAVSPRNPVFDSDTGSRNMEAAFVDMASRAQTRDAAFLRQPAERLRAAIEEIAAELARNANPWFRALNDLELIRQLVVPYFQSLPEDGATRQMIDVGACVGETADPFLAMGWKADLFEPDPACGSALAALAGRYGARASVHPAVISSTGAQSVKFYQSATGLSGMSPSPYGATAATLEVPSTRLSDHVKARRLERVDFLKIDAEGWDFDALRSHDFAAAAPRLAMLEFGTEFPRQTMEEVVQGIAEMADKGYDALALSYEDDGNFKRQVWRYALIAASFGAPVRRKDGQAGGNILFFRRGDTLFLTVVLRALLGYLPPCDRQRHYASLQ
jgi:FkbM family methyltransferase